MDPNETLRRIREQITQIVEVGGASEQAIDLAELIDALDEWLSKGGFLPAAWEREAT